MFKHIKVVSVLSLILFLAGIFCIIFSINEINTVTAENSGKHEISFENLNAKKIIINGSIPMLYEWDYGDEFSVSVDNINSKIIEVSEDGDELYINYEIKSKNMDKLFLPLISYATNTRPIIKITIPKELTVAECNDNSIDYYFNFDLMKVINSRYYPDTKIEIILEEATNITTVYDITFE